jgi:hypothetical protein
MESGLLCPRYGIASLRRVCTGDRVRGLRAATELWVGRMRDRADKTWMALGSCVRRMQI